MPIIKVTKADLAKTLNLNPGWYQAQIVRVHPPKKSSAGDSINFQLDYLIEHSSGKEIPVTYNSKLMGKINEPYKAVFGKDMDTDTEFDLDQLLGKKLDVKIQPVEYNGNMIDNIVGCLPYKKSMEANPY